ncbi:MAG: hypothetical protein Q7T39_23330 [Polaromonas sp.]|nr:hypothetical protein [Polaromonas sp.]
MDPKTILAGLPDGLRKDLLGSFDLIVRNYREHRWEPSELNGGKLCEAVYSILNGHVTGKMPAKSKKPQNFVMACNALEQFPSTFPRSVRVQLPRLLLGLWEIRNNRGVGHTGGDVDPNSMDARLVLESSKWIMAELVRIFNDIPIAEATEAVERLTERTLPMVWEIGDTKRVLDPSLSMRDQTLLLLYSVNGAVDESKLFAWVEHSSSSAYRRDVLKKLHTTRLAEYNQVTKKVSLTPLGINYVEENLPLAF